jgi:hypothetical protein
VENPGSLKSICHSLIVTNFLSSGKDAANSFFTAKNHIMFGATGKSFARRPFRESAAADASEPERPRLPESMENAAPAVHGPVRTY